MSRDLTKTKRKEKIVNLPISKFIDTKFRDYAVYVLEARGIPGFMDALTPVQRYILKNSPTTFQKTLTVVGKVIQSGYHHGNSSIESALSRLARPFGNALQLLNGYGFFGSEVSPDAAAARYTSVKISSVAYDILNKYKHLHVKDEDGPYEPLWMDIPLGLTMPIIGIAVGYKTSILPRKMEHIQEFLAGKRKKVEPYFEGYTGIVEPYTELGNSWILSSAIAIHGNKIHINELPPVLKYATVLKKLESIMNKFENKVKIINNSNVKVDIDIHYLGGNKEEWVEVQTAVVKAFSIIVSECPVFIKDNQVLVYDNIEQYLQDYKYQVKQLNYRNIEWEFNKLNSELSFNEAKLIFIEFILKQKRTNLEITEHVKGYVLDIKERLDRMTSRKFTKDELLATKKEILDLNKSIISKGKELTVVKAQFEKLIDPTIARGLSSNKSTINLFETEDLIEVDGVTVWTGDNDEDYDGLD
jgi:hypothetical protein